MMPSSQIEYRQYPHIEVSRTIPAGKKLVILAESLKGPKYEPIHVFREEIARDLFGDSPLVERYKEVVAQSGDADILLMRIDPSSFQDGLYTLSSYEFDLLYVDNVSFGNSMEDVLAFIEFAKTKEESGQLIHGFVNLRPFDNIKELHDVFDFIESLSIEGPVDKEEWGKYFSVVVDQLDGKKAGMMYAALVNSLEPEVNPVNKTIRAAIKQTLTKTEMLKLKKAGIVCFQESYHYGVVPSNSTCAVSTVGSVHKNIANFRIVQSLVQECSIEFSQLIGHTGMQFLSLKVQEILQDILGSYLNESKIKDFDYSIDVNQLQGHIYVGIEVVPLFSVEKMMAHSQVRIFR